METTEKVASGVAGGRLPASSADPLAHPLDRRQNTTAVLAEEPLVDFTLCARSQGSAPIEIDVREPQRELSGRAAEIATRQRGYAGFGQQPSCQLVAGVDAALGEAVRQHAEIRKQIEPALGLVGTDGRGPQPLGAP